MKSRRSLLVILAVLLIVLSIVGPEDPFSVLDSVVIRFSDSLQVVLTIFIIPLIMLHGFSYMIGTGILALIAGYSVKKWDAANSRYWRPLTFPVISLLWLVSQALPFLSIPTGTHIRPMGWAMSVMMSSLTLMVIGITRSVVSFRRGQNKTACSLSLLVSIALLIVPSISLHVVASVKGLILSP